MEKTEICISFDDDDEYDDDDDEDDGTVVHQ